MSKRKQHAPEFKAKMAREPLKGGATMSELASKRFMRAGQPIRAGLFIMAAGAGNTCPFATLSDW